VHDGDQDGVLADGPSHVVGIDQGARVHRDIRHLESDLLEKLAGVQNRVVFDGRGDDVLSLLMWEKAVP
jgi:hypothetical protein